MTEAERNSIGRLVLPVNRPVRINLMSEDVIHDFGVPAFRSKVDVLPKLHDRLVSPDQDRRVPHLLRSVLRHLAFAHGGQDRGGERAGIHRLPGGSEVGARNE